MDEVEAVRCCSLLPLYARGKNPRHAEFRDPVGRRACLFRFGNEQGICARPDFPPVSSANSLADQHAVAVAVKAVTLLYGVMVSGKDFFAASERAHQGQQCRTWQMEICQ